VIDAFLWKASMVLSAWLVEFAYDEAMVVPATSLQKYIGNSPFGVGPTSSRDYNVCDILDMYINYLTMILKNDEDEEETYLVLIQALGPTGSQEMEGDKNPLLANHRKELP
jgi:hypothetical protein